MGEYNNKNLLIDTNILIYQLNGTIDLSEELASARGLYISAVTQAEMLAGVADRGQIVELKEYLSEFKVMPVSEEVATLAGAYKTALTTIGLKDLFLAATAQLHRLTLVTANKRDFKGVVSLKSIFVHLD